MSQPQLSTETRLRVSDAIEKLKNATDADYAKLHAAVEQITVLREEDILTSYETIMPMCLSLHGKPYTLKNFYMFSPLFKFLQPDNVVVLAARQVAKSQSTAAQSVMAAAAMPHFKILHVTPLFEQIRRFSTNYIRPLITQSPVRALWSGSEVVDTVLQRSFQNQATLFFSFASNNADRCRGLSVHRIHYDEVQDFDPDSFSVIGEASSASTDFMPTNVYTGTPKTLDGPAEARWRESSQAEWIIKCDHCNLWNIPTLDQHLLKMIGPAHDRISEKTPGVVCARCRKPLRPRSGQWLHHYESRRWKFSGYHIPQILMPMHYAHPEKWQIILNKQQGANNTSQARFINEVLGVSTDTGQKLVTESDLRAASTLPWENKMKPSMAVRSLAKEYAMRVLAVDWGGGGESGTSFTVIGVLGWSPEGEVHVLWSKRLLLSCDHMKEAVEVLHWFREFDCHYLAHDYTGAGTIRETIMIKAGVPMERILPVEYVGAARGPLIKFVPGSLTHPRNRYRLDKTRSLLNLCTAIRCGAVRFFQYDFKDTSEPGLLHDFLALVENKTQTRVGSDSYTIIRNSSMSDDFAQMCNIGSAALWHANKAWPDFSKYINMQVAMDTADFDYYEEPDNWATSDAEATQEEEHQYA
jgi:hypothetical protein